MAQYPERSPWCSAHEVHIDEEQLAWFQQQLQEAGTRPVVVFTHAPVLGSGLKAVLDVSDLPSCSLKHSKCMKSACSALTRLGTAATAAQGNIRW